MRNLVGLIVMMLLSASAVSGAPEEAPASDPAAEYFFYRCAACHSIGEGRRTGPDLVGATQWSRPDLSAAIQKMEKQVGPIPAEQIERIVVFLKDPAVQERIAAQKKRTEQKMRKELPQASYETGQSLFEGRLPLSGGGPACVSCHAYRGGGSTLGPDLTEILTKTPATLLTSAIQGANYRLMRPVYDDHRITAEEALHLTEYLAHPERLDRRELPDIRVVLGAAGLLIVSSLVGLSVLNVRRKQPARRVLRDRATERGRS